MVSGFFMMTFAHHGGQVGQNGSFRREVDRGVEKPKECWGRTAMHGHEDEKHAMFYGTAESVYKL